MGFKGIELLVFIIKEFIIDGVSNDFYQFNVGVIGFYCVNYFEFWFKCFGIQFDYFIIEDKIFIIGFVVDFVFLGYVIIVVFLFFV